VTWVRPADLVRLADIRKARAALDGVARCTPLEGSGTISSLSGQNVALKCENLQATGSFKVRGAYNRLAALTPEQRAAGVVAASGGNHAQGVALAARKLGIRTTVFMPSGAPIPKIQATRGYGASVVLEGETFEDAEAAAQKHGAEHGCFFVHPFDDPFVIAGQGTVGLEILEQCPEVGTVVVPVGGGGLVSGIAAAVKESRPSCRVVGVEARGAASALASRQAGQPVTLASIATFCDGIAVRRSGELTFAHMSSLVDDLVTVDDESAARAVLVLLERCKLVVEPAGAVGVAALLEHSLDLPEEPLVAVISGGNVDPLLLLRIVQYGLSSHGRYLSFRTLLDDRPGELHRLLGVLAEEGANVLSVEHHRTGAAVPMQRVEVVLSVETRDEEHADSLGGRLRREGYPVHGGPLFAQG
jgi:threonine dehydratase